MATADSVKAKLQGLIAKANEATGNTDADLTTAVDALVAGFGQGGGDTSIEDGLVSQTLTSYSNDRITAVGNYTFCDFKLLKSLDLPNAETAGTSAFGYLSALESINVQKLEEAGESCFERFPLDTISLPNLERVKGLYQFRSTNLKEIVLPKLYNVDYARTFYGSSLLEKADFTAMKSIGINCFSGCNALTTLILRKTDGITTLGAATVNYVGSPIHNGTGYIYVPSALIEEYKAATNWSTYADQFRAIEDYPEICGVSV